MRSLYALLVFFGAASLFAQGPPPAQPTQLVTSRLWVTPETPAPQQVPSANVQVSGSAGNATFFYWIVSRYTIGNSTPAGPFAITNAPNTLSGSNFDAVLWRPVSDAGITYDVLRTTTPVMPSGACACAVATNVSGSSTNDQSNSLSAYTVTTLDPNVLNLTISNEVQSLGVSHLILRQNGVQIADLSVGGVGGANAATNVNGFGSSITHGTFGPSSQAKAYFSLVCAANRWTCTNNAADGQGIDNGQITPINSVVQGTGNVNIMDTGIIEAFTAGANPTYQQQYSGELLYALVSMGIPEVNKFWANNTAIAYVNWVADNPIFGRPVFQATTIGATATATVNGTAVYVGFDAQVSADSTATVAVDGVTYFTVSGQNLTAVRASTTPYAVRIGGLSPTSHTVIVTKASGVNKMWLQFIAGNGGLSASAGNAFNPSGPTTFLLNAISCCTITNQAPYNAIIDQVVAQLVSDGFNLQVVDAASAFNGTIPAEINPAAQNHPSDVGHQIIATAVLNTMVASVTPYDRQNFTAFKNISLAQGLLCASATPTISSGFGTSPSIPAPANGSCAFTVNVGSGGTASSGVIGLGPPFASTGWNCSCNDVTTQSATVDKCKQTGTTISSATIGNFNSAGAAAAWVANDIVTVSCFAR